MAPKKNNPNNNGMTPVLSCSRLVVPLAHLSFVVVPVANLWARLTAQYLQRPEVLPFGDLAAGEAFAQNLLCRVPGRFRLPISPSPSGEEARQDPGDERQQPDPEQKRDEHPRPPETTPIVSGPGWPLPVSPGLEREEDRPERFDQDVHGGSPSVAS